jgi:hypothetical protein
MSETTSALIESSWKPAESVVLFFIVDVHVDQDGQDGSSAVINDDDPILTDRIEQRTGTRVRK